MNKYLMPTLTLYNSFVLSHVGEPSPPENLRYATPDSMTSITIEWDPPVYTGGYGTSIQKYKITISEIDYSVEESGNALSHTITADSESVMFNTLYEVEVTVVNTSGDESDPASITIVIEASGW